MQVDDGPTDYSYFTEIEFSRKLREAFGKATLIVGFNLKYDLHWARRLGVLPPEGVRIWDCQLAEFLLRGQQGSYPSLNESLSRFNLGKKDERIEQYWELGIDTTDIPEAELQFYNRLDVELTYKLYQAQLGSMSDKLKRLCMVMGLDLLVLQEMEWNGVKLNVELCKQKAEETAKELAEVSAKLLDFAPSRLVNFDSPHQLSCILYGGGFSLTVLDHVSIETYKSGQKKGQQYEKNHWKTEVFVCDPLFTPIKGSELKLKSKVGDREYPIYATGEDVLKQLKKPTKKHKQIVELLLKRAELEKLLGTYYGALPTLVEDMEWEDGCLHGQLNQCVARTGRLSSSNPNMQNFSAAVDEVLVTRFA